MILEVSVLDTLKIDTQQHKAFKLLQKWKYEHFVPILATKIINEEYIQLLTIQSTSIFCAQQITNKMQAIQVLFHILQLLWYLHQKQHFTGNANLQSLFVCNKQNQIKMKFYKSTFIKDFTFKDSSKDKSLAKQGIQFCFDFEKTAFQLDAWKWGVLAGQVLFGLSLETYIDKALLWDKVIQFETGLKIQMQFLGADDLIKIVSKCLSIQPKKRPKIPQIIPTFQKIIANIRLPLQQHIYKMQQIIQSSHLVTQELNLSENILLTDELKKKLTPHFIKTGSKQPKSYKPLFRAKTNNFNSNFFYQQCHQQNQLLVIIDTIDSGIICCYLDMTIALIQTAGMAGQFIKDSNMKSFIFSLKNQDSYKIVNKDKAYKSVPGLGPIIGDGDIILSNSGQNNLCNFPKSYQAPKIKKQTLTQKPSFNINNYDVYKVSY